MILCLTNSGDATSDYLIGKVREAGFPIVRLDTDRLDESWDIRLSDDPEVPDYLRGSTGEVRAAEVTTLWFRRPRPVPRSPGDAATAQFAAQEWTASIEGFLELIPHGRWMNYPGQIAAASHKPEQLQRARRYGLSVPEYLVTTSSARALEFLQRMGGQVVAKPLMSGFIERSEPRLDTSIYTSPVHSEHLLAQGHSLGCPTLFQRAIARAADVRVTVVDQELQAVAMTADDGRVDIRRNNFGGVEYARIRPPDPIRKALVDMVDSYGLRFAAADFLIARDGTWHFLEINPNGQWAWLDIVGATSLYRLFLSSFERALGTSNV